eukprot:TRINITY_DN1928_c0_g4_i1.p1 TRINITY_DN1928_c0_g4~~TRINITY_DN1928_c0_g4_i1.p1  ORF type:complete len:461 (+),score=98.41 TRINITY_DN1928_c0_g4_i1:25-1383(+)
MSNTEEDTQFHQKNNKPRKTANEMTEIKALPLSCLIGKERTKDTEQVRRDLESRGWTFLYKDKATPLLPSTSTIQEYLNDLNKGFFNLEQKSRDEYRQVVYPANRFGYFSTGRKEGYRFATGSKLCEFVLPCISKPSKSNDSKVYVPFHQVAASCDEICLKIFQNQGQFLFGPTPQSSSSTTDSYIKQHIPLLNGFFKPHDRSNIDMYHWYDNKNKPENEHSFGLFDIVKYRPKSQFPSEFSTTDSQVNEHADPGLFSLSLGSTAQGLEMFDAKKNEWIQVPLDVMVLWCGHAVTDVSLGQVKPGVHRVAANEEERLTCWYEVCVDTQVPKRRFDMNEETVQREKKLWIKEWKEGISMSKSGRGTVGWQGKIKGVTTKDMKNLVQANRKNRSSDSNSNSYSNSESNSDIYSGKIPVSFSSVPLVPTIVMSRKTPSTAAPNNTNTTKKETKYL